MILPSIYHRFWITGKGWAMARDLKAGDALRLLDGRARVAAIELADVVPVFNLTVAASTPTSWARALAGPRQHAPSAGGSGRSTG